VRHPDNLRYRVVRRFEFARNLKGDALDKAVDKLLDHLQRYNKGKYQQLLAEIQEDA